eukprot:7921618-Pyramimonas_sp.AAC.1
MAKRDVPPASASAGCETETPHGGPVCAAIHYERMVRGILTLARLRSFWAGLGKYLAAVKDRLRALG